MNNPGFPFVSAALLALLLPAATGSAQKTLSEKIDAMFQKAYPTDEPGAAVIATKAGKFVIRKSYGMASMELGVKTQPEMKFCLASVRIWRRRGVMFPLPDCGVRRGPRSLLP